MLEVNAYYIGIQLMSQFTVATLSLYCPKTMRSVIFEMIFWCNQIDPKTSKIFVRISALAYKKRSNQKSSVRESI